MTTEDVDNPNPSKTTESGDEGMTKLLEALGVSKKPVSNQWLTKFCGYTLQEILDTTGIRANDQMLKKMENHPDFQDYEWVMLGSDPKMGQDIRSNTTTHTHACTHAKFAVREHIVNAQDAVMDRLINHLGFSDVSSPAQTRDKIQRQIEDQKGQDLRYFDPKSSKKDFILFELVGQKAEQEQQNRYVADLTDRGTGVEPERFAYTIGSLENSGKSDDPLQIGALGHGGSSIHRWCSMVSCFSRAQGRKEILYTVFKTFEETVVNGKPVTLPTTFYLAHKETGLPMTFSPFDPETGDEIIDVGTKFRYVGLRFEEDYLPQALARNKSKPALINILDEMFPDPVVPVYLNDARGDIGKERSRRPVTGLLTKARKQVATGRIRHSNTNTAPLTIRFENNGQMDTKEVELDVEYFVQDYEDTLRDNYIESRADAFVVTHNGYAVDTLRGLPILRDILDFQHLSKDVFGVVSLDKLDTHSLWKLMNQNRERIAGAYLNSVQQSVAKALEGDDTLQALNEEYRNRRFQGTESSEDINEELAKEFADWLTEMDINPDDPPPGGGGGGGGGATEEVPDSIPVKDPPTFLEFRKDVKAVEPGRRFQIGIKTDIFVGHLKRETISVQPISKYQHSPTLDVSNVSNPKNMRNCLNITGYYDIRGLEMPEDAVPGDTYLLYLKWKYRPSPDEEVLELETPTPLTIKTKEPKKGSNTKKLRIEPDVRLTDTIENPEVIAEVYPEDTKLVVLVNENHAIIKNTLHTISSDKRRDQRFEEYRDAFMNTYLSEIGFAAMVWFVEEGMIQDLDTRGSQDPTPLDHRLIQAAKSAKRHFLKKPSFYVS